MCFATVDGIPFIYILKKMDMDILCHLNLVDLIASLGCSSSDYMYGCTTVRKIVGVGENSVDRR